MNSSSQQGRLSAGLGSPVRKEQKSADLGPPVRKEQKPADQISPVRKEQQQPAGLGSSVQEFCRTSSAHGLGHLPDSSGHARWLWLAIVLALMVALVYNISVSLHREVVIQPVRTENTWVS